MEQGTQGVFGSFLTETGSWWGVEHLKDASGKWYQQPTDIDVVGISSIENTAVIGECKFRNEKIDKGIYENLISQSGLISGKYTDKAGCGADRQGKSSEGKGAGCA